jgi:hypothetical protein
MALSNAPLISSPDYNHDYIFYILASTISVAGFLFQIDDGDREHVIYYISKNLSWPPLKYNHEEKLALAVQKLRHYILLRTTKVIADSNPMQYLLSCRKINGKFPDGSFSFKSTISNFQHLRERKLSSSPNLSRPSPLILPIPPSILTSPTNISFISLRMILGTMTSSSTSEPKSSVTTSHEMIIVVFATRLPDISSSEISYIGDGSTPYFVDA